MSAAVLTASLTALMGTAVILPQILRVLRLESAAGVAVAGLQGSVWGYTGWLVYTARGGGGWSYLALAVPAGLQAMNLLLVLARGGDRRGSMSILAAGALVCVGVVIWPLSRAVWVLLAMGALAYLPTILSAWHAPAIHGVSRTAWTLSCLHALGWGAHGLAISDAFVVTNGAVNVTGSILVLLATFVRHDVWRRPLDTSPGLR